VRRRDEVGDVARAFDDMADRVVGLLRAQTELLANVAHELRTPLARIRVALDLAEDADAAAARESLAEIATDLAELERLVDDILATARMDLAQNTTGDGAPPLRRSRVAVEDVVAGATQRLAQAHPGRRVEVRVDPGLPALEGDPVLLRRALDNLLDNARKYSAPETEIAVRAARRGDELVLQVIDRGEGMSREDLERLFAPFFRADRSRARRTGGVGLGLTLTRRIVEAHGGSVRAESTPGVGTTMTVVLPLPASGEAAAPRTARTT
jgi:signal transduction histidine kinase